MRKLHIVGGGLAGMTVAWEVAGHQNSTNGPARRFDEICLYERDRRLGGKAGSDKPEVVYLYEQGEARSVRPPVGNLSDHGYHLFPTWYDNVIEIMGEIGVSYDEIAVEGERFRSFPKGANLSRDEPRLRRNRLKSFAARVLPLSYDKPRVQKRPAFVSTDRSGPAMFMFFVTAIDLVSAADRHGLRKHTIDSWLKTYYPIVGRSAREVYESLLLKALAADVESMSAVAVAKMFTRWATPLRRLLSASWSSLDGSLQARFIAEFHAALLRRDVVVRVEHTLERIEVINRRATLFFDTGEVVTIGDGDVVVLAVTPDVLAEVTTPGGTADEAQLRLHEAAQAMAEMTEVFSACDVYFKENQNVPRQHFGFPPKDVATTAYDISPVWKDEDLEFGGKPTVLQLVLPAPDPETVENDEALISRIVDDLGTYLVFEQSHWVVHTNTEARLSLANQDIYDVRASLPQPSELGEVFIAGDFMQSSIGVPSMEAAVGNGRNVAAAILGQPNPDPDRELSPLVRIGASVIRAVSRLILSPIIGAAFIGRSVRGLFLS